MRNRYFDLLRFLAIVRVVVYHVTGWAFLTLAFPAMSVMFALAGSLMAASCDRWGTAAIGRRLRRLLPSLWLVAALFVPAMLLTGLPVSWRLLFWVVPLADPPVNAWGALALSVIWYLRDYLWFVLVSPLARRLFRRWPLPTLLAPYLLLFVVELGYPGAPAVLRDFGLYFGAWLLGFAHHDGMLRRLSRRLLVSLVVAVGAAGAAWIFTHPGPRGYDLNDIRIGNALWSAAFVLLVFGLAPAAAAWVDRRAPVGRAVTVLNSRALTVYLWHMPFVIALDPLLSGVGLRHSSTAGLLARLAGVAVLVTIAVMAFGWVEDLAARRRPCLLPGGAVPVQGTTPAVVPPRTVPVDATAAGVRAPARPVGTAPAPQIRFVAQRTPISASGAAPPVPRQRGSGRVSSKATGSVSSAGC
ncbi:acyltransferase family protein [Plantactinospora soyae]|uniref:Peptidoglycan/LPS O-acetylase OafA/YrhL n=1 Tax=Plantactinospora soyae TaxID=1544732 RepID=A0A927ME43_9ACTN|nr:acyltransferase [Plantactinospora soyae]MBE1492844.1 peptidoglycan/LPS O-acetylase OafA/YrhL [Plantactinospora soyae]